MAVTIRGERDEVLERFAKALSKYAQKHPKAKVTLFRQGPACVRVRIIDPAFRGIDRLKRDELVWPLLAKLPEDELNELYTLLLLPPEETKKSIANMDFENPVTSER